MIQTFWLRVSPELRQGDAFIGFQLRQGHFGFANTDSGDKRWVFFTMRGLDAHKWELRKQSIAKNDYRLAKVPVPSSVSHEPVALPFRMYLALSSVPVLSTVPRTVMLSPASLLPARTT